MAGPDNVSSTTTTQPPAWLNNILAGAGSIAKGQFDRRQNGSEPGGRILPNSQRLVNNTILGKYLSPDSNPHLQQTFDRAADLTQTRLSSEFAGAGRDLGAAQPARSEELQTLASNIFGGNFQAERDRQVNAVNQGQGLDPLNRLINQLAGIIPGAGGATQSTQPVYQTGIFSDRRLKRNIERIGTKNGYPWYSFEYIWGEKAEGYMADELPKEFVGSAFGFATVDYAGIG